MIPLAATIRSNRLELHRRLLQILGQLFKYWSCDPCGGESKCAWADLPRTAVEAYAALWDRINPKQPWSSNPWVWRIEFERK